MLVGAYLAERYDRHYYAKAQNLGRRLRAHYAAALERFDVLVMPTTRDEGAAASRRRHAITEILGAALATCTTPRCSTSTGHPAISVPCGLSDGLPIGMMLVGRHFDDATVLRAGHAFQASSWRSTSTSRSTTWSGRSPSTSTASGCTSAGACGRTWVELAGAQAPIHLLARPGPDKDFSRHRTLVHLDFAVDDLDAAVERAIAAGGTHERTDDYPGLWRLAAFADPAGNGVDLIQAEPGAYDKLTRT